MQCMHGLFFTLVRTRLYTAFCRRLTSIRDVRSYAMQFNDAISHGGAALNCIFDGYIVRQQAMGPRVGPLDLHNIVPVA